MLQRLRVLVSLALFVAVPVQGIAAVAGGLCMASAGQGTGAASHAHGGDAGESGHQHEPEAGSTASHALCGPCVACCASAAIIGDAAIPVPFAIESAPLVFSQPPPATLRRDRLDRPPLPA
jgi:hypothetical protein